MLGLRARPQTTRTKRGRSEGRQLGVKATTGSAALEGEGGDEVIWRAVSLGCEVLEWEGGPNVRITYN